MGLYKRKNSRFWWMSYVSDGEQHCESTGTTNKQLARKILALREAEIIEGRFRLPKSNPPKLKQWAEQYLESIHNPNTNRVYRSIISMLLEFFGDVSLAHITPARIEEFKSARTKAGAGPAIINRNLAFLRRIMKVAARQRLIARSPFDEVEFLNERIVRRQAKVLSFNEQKRLEAVAPPLLRALIVLLTETGLRVRKEALPLKWQDVDLAEGAIYVHQSKTPAGQRAAPMTKYCVSVLKKWANLTGPQYSSYVFPHPRNPCIHLKSVRKTWARTLKVAKLEYRPIYNLRATFASRLSTEGVSDNLVAGMLGHSSPSIVGTYAKVVDESRKKAIQKLNDARASQGHALPEPDQKTLAQYYASQKWIN